VTDPLFYARAVHFAASIMAAGTVFFVVFIAEPALRTAPPNKEVAAALYSRFAWIAWIGLALAVFTGAAWLLLVASSMSGEPVRDLLSQGVLRTVLLQTDFGNDWLVRFGMAFVLARLFVSILSVKGATSSLIKTTAIIVAASFVGSLAFSGHAIGGQGMEGIIHPTADILHLIAVAAWVGTLVPLALLLAMTGRDAATLAVARNATLRFSTLGLASVAIILVSGIINNWYLVGGVLALTGTVYGQLLMIKIALFAVMVAIASINRSWLTPRLVAGPSLSVAQKACRTLCRNAWIEMVIGGFVIAIVAVLGTLAPASHVNRHAIAGAMPPDASFQHIHSEQGMADVMIEPGRVGTVSVTIHLLNEDLETLAAQSVTLTLTAPRPSSKPITRLALQDADGNWHVDRIKLTEPGNWAVTVDAILRSHRHLQLSAPIVIGTK
jgi:putative copper resistance protein D